MAGHPSDVTYEVVPAPPQGMRIRYYLGGHIPAHYRAWVEKDIESPDWPFRTFIARVPLMVMGGVLPVFLFADAAVTRWFILGGPLAFASAALLFYAGRNMQRAMALSKHRRYWKEH